MSQALKVISKIKRKERKVKEAPKDVVKMHKSNMVMQGSPGVQKAVRSEQRRLDNYFGLGMVSNQLEDSSVEYNAEMTTVERFDYDLGAGEDYGIKITMSAAIKQGAGLVVGDLIQPLEGALEGRMLTVVEDSSSTEVRCEDVATFTTESSVSVRMLLSATKKSFV